MDEKRCVHSKYSFLIFALCDDVVR